MYLGSFSAERFSYGFCSLFVASVGITLSRLSWKRLWRLPPFIQDPSTGAHPFERNISAPSSALRGSWIPVLLLEAGTESADSLRKIEDEDIHDIVKTQLDLGFYGITDGKYRRHVFWGPFWPALGGMKELTNPDPGIFRRYIPHTVAFTRPGFSPRREGDLYRQNQAC